jgi:CheY-like chemotaxis protein
LNMITNAKDAMLAEGGTLTIKVESKNDNIRIMFQDTGCGIPDEIKGKIFDPFVTTKGALGKSETPGTGLGLFLTYGIIDSYQGKIEVESEVGKGAKFTILIPISKNLAPESFLKKKSEPPEEIQKKLNILLVDDEMAICKTLGKFLKSKGHQVTFSVKAKEGLNSFKKEKFDVVLSDITMPDMDGIELVKRIREKDKKTKIIIMTGHILRRKEEEAKDAGADEVLIKPFENKLLYQTISRLVSE